MGRAPCCDKTKVKKGPWSPEEDATLKNYIEKYGTGGNWIALPLKAGLKRCGKSCRLRWLNYLRPDIKHGGFTDEEDIIICTLYSKIGSRWSVIASHLPGRTDNDVKNHWNTKLKKKIMAATNHNNNTPLISSLNYNHNPYNSNPTASTLHALSPSMDLSPQMGPNGTEVNLGTEMINTQSLMPGLAHPAGLTTDQVCDQFQDSTSIVNHMSSTWSDGNTASSSSGEFGFSMDLGTGYSLDDDHQLWAPHDQESGFGTSYADLVNFLLS